LQNCVSSRVIGNIIHNVYRPYGIDLRAVNSLADYAENRVKGILDGKSSRMLCLYKRIMWKNTLYKYRRRYEYYPIASITCLCSKARTTKAKKRKNFKNI